MRYILTSNIDPTVVAAMETATTVRNRDGETLLTDGPFAEVAEHFGGFWIIEADDLDTALRHARD